MRRACVALVALLALGFGSGFTGSANAGVYVSFAQIAAGKLIIKGRTERSYTEVIMDGGRASARATRSGHFIIRAEYLPPDCTVTLSGEETVRKVILIAMCGPRGEPGPAGAPGAASGMQVNLRTVECSGPGCRGECPADEVVIAAHCPVPAPIRDGVASCLVEGARELQLVCLKR